MQKEKKNNIFIHYVINPFRVCPGNQNPTTTLRYGTTVISYQRIVLISNNVLSVTDFKEGAW